MIKRRNEVRAGGRLRVPTGLVAVALIAFALAAVPAAAQMSLMHLVHQADATAPPPRAYVVTASPSAASFDITTIVRSRTGGVAVFTDCTEFLSAFEVRLAAGEIKVIPAAQLYGTSGKNCSGDSFPFSLAPFRVMSGDVELVTQRASFRGAGYPAFFHLDALALDLVDGPVTLPGIQNDGTSYVTDVALFNKSSAIVAVRVGSAIVDMTPHSYQLVRDPDNLTAGACADLNISIDVGASGTPHVYVIGFVNSVAGGSPDPVSPVRTSAAATSKGEGK